MPNVSVLLCLMPDNFTCLGVSATIQWVECESNLAETTAVKIDMMCCHVFTSTCGKIISFTFQINYISYLQHLAKIKYDKSQCIAWKF